MKNTFTIFLSLIVVALFSVPHAVAQESGDYRTAASGDWSAAATWETYDGTSWNAASTAPDGSEDIIIYDDHVVSVDVNSTITGYVTVQDTSELEVSESATLEFGAGSTYEHARDGGSMPVATWGEGSTALLTGIEFEAPDNRGQNYYNLTINTPDHAGNKDMSLGGHTISGDLTVIETGGSRWRLIGGDSGTITIMGDVIVEGGSLETLGTGSLTDVIVNHHGDINVTGGNFSISRGSQANGLGTTTWNLLEGNMSLSNAETENSNPTGAKFVFAANGSQEVVFDNVDFDGTSINYDVSDSTSLEITDGAGETDFMVTGTFTNYGSVTATGVFAVDGDGTYNHAIDGGEVPDITWEEGSTMMLTGTVGDAPDNRGQDYYNLVLNTPEMNSNQDLDLAGNTISGDLTVLDSGSARWRLVGGEDATITIMGDVTVEDGNLETMGSGSVVDIVVEHYGDIDVNGGVFAITRGSQGDGEEGTTGTTTWNLYEGNFSIDSAQTRNSNKRAGNAKFVFAGDSVQTLTIGSEVEFDELPVEVSSGATLDLGSSIIAGDDIFIVSDGGTVATSNAGGISAAIQTEGEVTIAGSAGFMFYGTEEQTTGLMGVADSVGSITVSNMAGISFNDTLYAAELNVTTGAVMQIDTAGSIGTGGGIIEGWIVNHGEITVDEESSLSFEAGSQYEHARDGGAFPSGTWAEGSNLLITGTYAEGPDNGNQNYYDVTINTPDNVNNNYLGMVGTTVSGDVHIITTGIGRWYLSGGVEVGETARVDVMGDIIQEEGNFSAQGTGTADSHYEIYVHGDIDVSGGNFSVSRGSQGNGTGSTNWYLYGDFTMTDAMCQNSNPDNSQWVFAGDGEVQTLTLTDVEINGSGMQIVVQDGAILDLGLTVITSGGNFTTESGSTLQTSHPDAFDGNIQITGTASLSTEGNYTFNGSQAQVTSKTMPLRINGMTIDNEAGVTQSRSIVVDGFVELVSGQFDNTIGFTLSPGAEIIYEGGSLLIPVSSELEPTVPDEFALNQNYPNPFNPSTTIQYDVPKAANVRLTVFDMTGRVVAELVNGRESAGTHTVQFNANGIATGVYLYRLTAGNFTSVKKLTLIK